MRTSKQRIAALLAMAMLSSGLSGCALLHFDDPAEIKAQEEEIAKQQNVELPDAKALLDTEKLVIDEEYVKERFQETISGAFPLF